MRFSVSTFHFHISVCLAGGGLQCGVALSGWAFYVRIFNTNECSRRLHLFIFGVCTNKVILFRAIEIMNHSHIQKLHPYYIYSHYTRKCLPITFFDEISHIWIGKINVERRAPAITFQLIDQLKCCLFCEGNHREKTCKLKKKFICKCAARQSHRYAWFTEIYVLFKLTKFWWLPNCFLAHNQQFGSH